MGEGSTSDSGQIRPSNEATYVVQRWEENAIEGVGDPKPGWFDIATVTVPARTHRKTVIAKALDEARAVPLPGGKIHVRVLDEESATAATVESVQPDPQLRIGS